MVAVAAAILLGFTLHPRKELAVLDEDGRPHFVREIVEIAT